MIRNISLDLGTMKLNIDADTLHMCDSLTGAFNRRILESLSERFLRDYKILGETDKGEFEECWITLMMTDLNGFKQINDVYGHDVGDKCLIHFTRTVESSVRAKDIVIRLGGDEFLVIFAGVDSSIASSIAERILSSLNTKPLDVPEDNVKLRLQGSFGVVVFKMKYFIEEEGWEKFLKVADRVMMNTKNSIGAGYKMYVYNPDVEDPDELSLNSGADDMRRPQQTLCNSFIDFIHAIDGYSKHYAGRCRYLADGFLRWTEVNPLGEIFAERYPNIHSMSKSRTSRLILLDTVAFHDIGKVYVPKDILLKKDKPTDKEWKNIKGHVTQGAELLKTILRQTYPLKDVSNEKLDEIIKGSMQHHENWEGSGYPDNLYETDISEFGRFIAIIGSYSSMLSKRPFAPEQSVSFVIRELLKGSGKQFDPVLVNIFLAYLASEYPDDTPQEIMGIVKEFFRKMK